MKLNINIRHTREIVKSLKIGTNSLEIKTKKEDYTIIDTKDIIFLF